MKTTWLSLGALMMGMLTLTSASLTLGGCGDDEEGKGAELSLTGEDPLFPGFEFDTGLVPSGSPVQASFSVLANGSTSVAASAVASGSVDTPTLTGLPRTGEVSVSGSFGLAGRLVVDVSGLPPYDGPIPGIENVAIDFAGATPFDPFSLGTPVSARADIPPATLPEIPLPGGIPGALVLEVAEGSFVEASTTGAHACVDDTEARYEVDFARAGTLVIRPTIVIDVPLLGEQTFEIPSFEVPLSLGATTLTATAAIDGFGSKPASGDHQSGHCSGVGSGGASATGGGVPVGGGSAGGSGGAGTACTSAADCAGLPCVDGRCSMGGGICESGTTFGDAELDACVSSYCCDEVETCTYAFSDIDGCNACIEAGSGARCDALVICMTTQCQTPAGWSCDVGHYGTGDGCDCGCGEVDPDCPDSSADSCQYCDLMGSCGDGGCPGNIDPNNNAVCL